MRCGALVLPRDAQRERLHPAGQRVRGGGLEHAAEQLAAPAASVSISARRAHQRAGRDIAVAVEVFRGRVHDEVDAERRRLLIDRARKRVVDDGRHTSAPGTPAATRAMSTQRSVGLIGDSNHTHLRLRSDQALRLGQLLERREP